MKKKNDNALVFILSNAEQTLLTANQEIELGTIIQRGLKDTASEKEKIAAKNAKNDLVNHNIKLVAHVAKQYQGYRIPLEDLVEEGIIGCMTAAEKFDPERGCRFSTAAVPWIRQQITRYIAENRKVIRLPSHVAEALSKINKLTEQYMQNHEGRIPTDQEIADMSEGKLTVDKIQQYKTSTQPIASLSVSVGDEEDTELEEIVTSEDNETPDDYMQETELHSEMEKLINTLPELQAKIIRLRYGLNSENKEYTLEEVGEIIGFTRERIRQLESDALLTLKINAQNNKKQLEELRGK
jgi:RNA polymerase primary sigma factor